MSAGFNTRLISTCGTTHKEQEGHPIKNGRPSESCYLDEGRGGIQAGQYCSLGSYIDIHKYINIYHFLKVVEGSKSSLTRDLSAHKHAKGQSCTLLICLGMAGGADNFHLEPTLATRRKQASTEGAYIYIYKYKYINININIYAHS